MRLRTVTLLAAIGLSSSGELHAQDSGNDMGLLGLDSLLNMSVSAASLYEQSRTEAPAQVTIVTAEEIAAFGYRSLSDVLGSVAGFTMSSDLQYDYTGVRGFGRPADFNNRVLFLVDGHTVNEGILGATPVGSAFLVGMEAVERVEIIRGPASPLYGTRAMLAVVNVIRKKGRDLDGWKVSAQSGNYGTRGAAVIGGGETESGLQYSLQGEWEDSDGQDFYFPEFDTPAANGGTSVGNNWRNAFRSSGSVSFRGLSFTMAAVRREQGIPTAPYGLAFNDPRARNEDQQGFAEVVYSHQFRDGLVGKARVGHDRFKTVGTYPLALAMMSATLDTRATSAEALVQWDAATGHRVVAGVHGQRVHDALIDQRAEGLGTLFEGDFPYTVFSVFAQDEVQITRSLALTVGFRHDAYGDDLSTTNPRAALVFHADDRTTVKAVFGTAFRKANVYERFWETSTSHRANPDIQPERIRTIEAAVERRLTDGLSVQVGWYNNRMTDLIDQVPTADERLQFQNRSRVKATGLETEVSWSRAEARGFLRYALQRATDDATDRGISNYATHSLKAGTYRDLHRGVRLGVDLLAESGRQTLRGVRLPNIVLLNATLSSRPILDRLVISGSVRNLLDRQYRVPGGYQHVQDGLAQVGRRLFVKIEVGL